MDRETTLERYVRQSLLEGAEVRAKLATACTESALDAASRIFMAFQNGGKLLIFGNGGSAADAQHMAAEFVGRFLRERDGLPAIALTTDSSVFTSVGNDYGFEQIFARQIKALGRAGDVAIGISTSGNSRNVVEGFGVARELGLTTILLTGDKDGLALRAADLAIAAPSTVVWQIQECHSAIIHVLCGAVEELLAGSLRE